MGIKRSGSSDTVAAAPAKRTPPKKVEEPKAAETTTEEKAEAPAETKPSAPAGIVTPRDRARRAAAGTATTTASDAPKEEASLDDWALSGDQAMAKAQAELAKREQEKEERRARGYWPREFRLIPPGTPSRRGPINDRYTADVIVLDHKMGPAFNLHREMNPRTNRLDIYEPCPKEWDSCVLCPPTGKYESRFVQLLTLLNITGYQIQTGDRMGEWVPMSQELAIVELGNMPFFHAVMQEHGTLRGLHLTFTRNNKNEPDLGIPTFSDGEKAVAEPVFHTEEALEKFIRDNGMWQQKRTRPSTEFPNGELIDEREDWLRHPFDYGSFLHKPSGADLRARYTGGTGAPLGANTGSEGGQWGNSRFEPGQARPPAQGGMNAGSVPDDADLSDDEPF